MLTIRPCTIPVKYTSLYVTCWAQVPVQCIITPRETAKRKKRTFTPRATAKGMGWGGGRFIPSTTVKKRKLGVVGIYAKNNCQTEKGGIYNKNNYQSGEEWGSYNKNNCQRGQQSKGQPNHWPLPRMRWGLWCLWIGTGSSLSQYSWACSWPQSWRNIKSGLRTDT